MVLFVVFLFSCLRSVSYSLSVKSNMRDIHTFSSLYQTYQATINQFHQDLDSDQLIYTICQQEFVLRRKPYLHYFCLETPQESPKPIEELSTTNYLIIAPFTRVIRMEYNKMPVRYPYSLESHSSLPIRSVYIKRRSQKCDFNCTSFQSNIYPHIDAFVYTSTHHGVSLRFIPNRYPLTSEGHILLVPYRIPAQHYPQNFSFKPDNERVFEIYLEVITSLCQEDPSTIALFQSSSIASSNHLHFQLLRLPHTWMNYFNCQFFRYKIHFSQLKRVQSDLLSLIQYLDSISLPPLYILLLHKSFLYLFIGKQDRHFAVLPYLGSKVNWLSAIGIPVCEDKELFEELKKKKPNDLNILMDQALSFVLMTEDEIVKFEDSLPRSIRESMSPFIQSSFKSAPFIHIPPQTSGNLIGSFILPFST